MCTRNVVERQRFAVDVRACLSRMSPWDDNQWLTRMAGRRSAHQAPAPRRGPQGKTGLTGAAERGVLPAPKTLVDPCITSSAPTELEPEIGTRAPGI